jgi:hypothetical protein
VSIYSSIVAEIMFQAAVAVGHHAKSTPLSAIRDACIRVCGGTNESSYHAYIAAIKMYKYCMNNNNDPWLFELDGPSWQMWLSRTGRDQMVTALLFVYEYIVTEMSGDRVEIPSIVTPCNTNQTDVHSTSDVV